MDIRISYWKTVVAGAAGTLGIPILYLIVVVSSTRLPGDNARYFLAWVLLLIATAAVWSFSFLLLTGGIVSLHRYGLEKCGKPYVTVVRRERIPGKTGLAAHRFLRRLGAFLNPGSGRLSLRPGEIVEIKSLDEILETLDGRGTLDSIPFMPEMSAFCGSRFRVLRRVDKLNDWVHGTGLRRVRDMVLLENLRCDGAHHGDCQTRCHLRWKESWLRRPSEKGIPLPGSIPMVEVREACSESNLHRSTHAMEESGSIRYFCQATELTAGSTPLRWWGPIHHLRDLYTGNLRLMPFLAGVSVRVFNWFQEKRGGIPFPHRNALKSKISPHAILELAPGEYVRVKRKSEIEETLSANFRNRGLWFDIEMFRHCGGEYRVAARVDRLIQERTGKILRIANPCILLEGVTATGEYKAFCPENEYIFWREIWLERSCNKESGDSVNIQPKNVCL